MSARYGGKGKKGLRPFGVANPKEYRIGPQDEELRLAAIPSTAAELLRRRPGGPMVPTRPGPVQSMAHYRVGGRLTDRGGIAASLGDVGRIVAD